MPESSSYGEAFGQRLHAQATSFVSRSLLRKTTLAVTELKYKNPQHRLSTPPVRENAFMVALHLRDYPVYEYWEDGRPAPVSAIKAGNTIIYDIKRKPVFHLTIPSIPYIITSPGWHWMPSRTMRMRPKLTNCATGPV
jgi:AraC family transcriptional regulator